MKGGSLKLKAGSAELNDAYTGEFGELTIDLDGRCFRVHDGKTPGGAKTVPADKASISVGDLENDGFWTYATLTRLSQLEDDIGLWKKSDLTKLSQLANDSKYLTSHCTYCTHCSYCTNCS